MVEYGDYRDLKKGKEEHGPGLKFIDNQPIVVILRACI